MRHLWHVLFVGDMNLCSGVEFRNSSTRFVFKGAPSAVLADEAALKQVYAVKGASGTLPCAACQNSKHASHSPWSHQCGEIVVFKLPASGSFIPPRRPRPPLQNIDQQGASRHFFAEGRQVGLFTRLASCVAGVGFATCRSSVSEVRLFSGTSATRSHLTLSSTPTAACLRHATLWRHRKGMAPQMRGSENYNRSWAEITFRQGSCTTALCGGKASRSQNILIPLGKQTTHPTMPLAVVAFASLVAFVFQKFCQRVAVEGQCSDMRHRCRSVAAEDVFVL